MDKMRKTYAAVSVQGLFINLLIYLFGIFLRDAFLVVVISSCIGCFTLIVLK